LLITQSSRFTPRDQTHRTHWIGVWVGPRTGLHYVLNRRELPAPLLPVTETLSSSP
jgi:hypothetical protein